mmetsp:Transcript_100456/g.292800  ORF Transcript_100456/g.292800 Transcript_100456/m.292800 type:complete len:230 (+) Transcript_100456:4451-5140(+)
MTPLCSSSRTRRRLGRRRSWATKTSWQWKRRLARLFKASLTISSSVWPRRFKASLTNWRMSWLRNGRRATGPARRCASAWGTWRAASASSPSRSWRNRGLRRSSSASASTVWSGSSRSFWSAARRAPQRGHAGPSSTMLWSCRSRARSGRARPRRRSSARSSPSSAAPASPTSASCRSSSRRTARHTSASRIGSRTSSRARPRCVSGGSRATRRHCSTRRGPGTPARRS